MGGFLKGHDLEKDTDSWSGGGGEQPAIPDKTRVLAFVERAESKQWEGDKHPHVSMQWRVVAPEQYKGRVIFEGLKVFDERDWLRQRSVEALIFIDRSMGGGVIDYLQADDRATPCDDDCPLSSWVAKSAVQLEVGVYKVNKKERNNIKGMSLPKDAKAAREAMDAYIATNGAPMGDAFSDDGDAFGDDGDDDPFNGLPF